MNKKLYISIILSLYIIIIIIIIIIFIYESIENAIAVIIYIIVGNIISFTSILLYENMYTNLKKTNN